MLVRTCLVAVAAVAILGLTACNSCCPRRAARPVAGCAAPVAAPAPAAMPMPMPETAAPAGK